MNEILSAVVRTEEAQRVRELAKQADRSYSWWVRQAIRRELERIENGQGGLRGDQAQHV